MSSSKLHISDRILAVHSDEEFDALAGETFAFQRSRNAVFRNYLNSIGAPETFDRAHPLFLPIEAFKHHQVVSSGPAPKVFLSSGTTGQQRSQHPVYDVRLYDRLAQAHFEDAFGPLKERVVLALLPSYLEAGDSSLVHMVQHFIDQALPESAFVPFEASQLRSTFDALRGRSLPITLFGVSYALADFCSNHRFDFDQLEVFETGGMKGRAKEITRLELHTKLKCGFPNAAIHSEYGMTELLSQAYCKDGQWFHPAPWLRAYCTDVSDPLSVLRRGQRGVLAFIDLANHHSCSFIQTRDIGIVRDDGAFTVEGRMDGSDLRGCNLLYTS